MTDTEREELQAAIKQVRWWDEMSFEDNRPGILDAAVALATAVPALLGRITSLEAEAGGWKDIALAPKDGTRVVLAMTWKAADYTVVTLCTTGYWTTFNGGGWVAQSMGKPYAWLPLPAGPPPPPPESP